MFDLESHLIDLLSIPAIPGNDVQLFNFLAERWRPWVDEIKSSRLGSLHALRRGSGKEPRKRMMITAHMDGVGMMVSGLEGAFIYIVGVGGLDARILPGQWVTVHGREDIPGVIVDPGDRLLPEDTAGKTTPIKHLLIDTGLAADHLSRMVRVGDGISFSKSPQSMAGGWVMGHTLDNRASLAAISACLERLQESTPVWDVWFVATVQEETTHAGAKTSGFELQPDLAVVLDTTFGASNGNSEPMMYPLDAGPALGIGPNVHPSLHRLFRSLAEELAIPYQIEVLPGNSMTDAHTLQVVSAGIPCMVVSIPILNMHTPVEVAALRDIQRAGELTAGWVSRLGSAIHDPFEAERTK